MTSTFAKCTLPHMSCNQQAELFAARVAHLACYRSPQAPAEALFRHRCLCSGLPHLFPSLSDKANSSQDQPQDFPPQSVNSNLLVFGWAAGYSAVHPSVPSQQLQDAHPSSLNAHAAANTGTKDTLVKQRDKNKKPTTFPLPFLKPPVLLQSPS